MFEALINRFRGGTQPRLRRNRGGLMKPSLRIKRITVLSYHDKNTGKRHASSKGFNKPAAAAA